MAYSVTTAPASEPITTAEAKTHLRVDVSTEDTYIDTLVSAARQWCEKYTNRALITQTITETFDTFPATGESLILTVGKVASVTSLKYYTGGVLTTWNAANYIVDVQGEQSRISEALDITWPDIDDRVNAVEVIYVVGTSSGSVPAAIKHAILLLVGSMYENREDTVKKYPSAIEMLLNPYRIWRF